MGSSARARLAAPSAQKPLGTPSASPPRVDRRGRSAERAEARASGAGATVRVGRDVANIAGGHAADEGDAMSRAPTCAPLRLAGWKMTCARLRALREKNLRTQPVSSGAMRVHTLSEKLRVDDQRAQWRRRGGGALTRRSPLFRVRLVSGAFTSAFAGACPSAARACPPRRYPQKRETRTTRPSRRTNPTSRDGIPPHPRPHLTPRTSTPPSRRPSTRLSRIRAWAPLPTQPRETRASTRPRRPVPRGTLSGSRSSVSTPRACARGRDATRSPPNAPLDGTHRTFDDDAWANLPRPPTGALKTLVRKGVPPDLRPRVWLARRAPQPSGERRPPTITRPSSPHPRTARWRIRSNLISTARSPRTRGWRRRKGRRRCDAC